VRFGVKIEIDLDVYKALTLRLEFENQTLNDVLRGMLELDSLVELMTPQEESQQLALESAEIAKATMRILEGSAWMPGFYSRGLVLPDGTILRARYKGNEYRAKIEGSRWVDHEGGHHHSPTAAAKAITGNSVNGWRFWEACRPSDDKWRRLDLLA
jgi:hypothetical protein